MAISSQEFCRIAKSIAIQLPASFPFCQTTILQSAFEPDIHIGQHPVGARTVANVQARIDYARNDGLWPRVDLWDCSIQ